jgi:hypothetical protein
VVRTAPGAHPRAGAGGKTGSKGLKRPAKDT